MRQLLLFSGYLYYTERVITHGPGVVAPDKPAQEHAFGVEEITFKDFILKPLAKFNAEARVLSKRAYTSDRLAEISPMDFFVGWGPMSDEKILNELLISQSNRYFDWQMTHRPIPLQQMVEHTANIHLIPSSDKINAEIRRSPQGSCNHAQWLLGTGGFA
ncbi:MAG: hypothetical protein U5K69_20590 [Balneolaceae bacterium]|nr:hypothetical protein [Balneolaceae bacterium]